MTTAQATHKQISPLNSLASRYPLTTAAFTSMPNGDRALQAVLTLEQQWMALNTRKPDASPFAYVSEESKLPTCSPEATYDIVIAGGGLGLVAGAALAARGLRVLVFDRASVGEAHREWNISERELSTLVQHGIFTHDQVASAVANRYTRGLISFDAAGTRAPACPLYLEGVLDVALDAQSVLDVARKRFLEAGGTILEGRSFRKLHMAQRGMVASVFEVEGPNGTEYYRARLAIDTMGSVSPIAVGLNEGVPFNGVCPTAGTVLEGIEADAAIGDVLVSVGPATGGRQLIWEGFPGKGNETTVYLFYYDRTGKQEALHQSLLGLFEQYFAQLPLYKKTRDGQPYRHLRPVFGYIPARYGQSGRNSSRGLLCLGDSAAGQSPLTFCGFGSFVRHIGRVSALVEFALKHDLLEEHHLKVISPHQPNLRVAWVFSRFMQPWKGSDPAATNRLMNVFCRALADLGPETTVRFLQDRYTFADYLRIMLRTARLYSGVFALTARVLGLRGLLKWAGDIAAFASDDLVRNLHKTRVARAWRKVERATRKVSPAAKLKVMARRSAWKATAGNSLSTDNPFVSK